MVSENYIRIEIDHSEAPYIYGTTIEGNKLCIKVCNQAYLSDTEALHKGDIVMFQELISQTKTVQPDTPTPDLYATRLIVYPDYLIDISTLAACFTESGPHPMRYLQSLLTPKEITRHILLGNTANQFLDDCVNQNPNKQTSYNTSILKAFTNDALRFAVCPDINNGFFHDTRCQYDNIQSAISKLQERYLKDSSSNGAMLEPSFICPVLGLQGRLDYLSHDLRLLVELKSGKADEYFSVPQGPKASHTAQMMLYREMIHINTGIPREEITSFLLYSRYPLFFTGEKRPHIVDEALVLRNSIVRLMATLAEDPNTALLIENLTPETFNTKPLTGKLWTNYLQPALNTFLSPFHTANKTVKAYVYRYLRFTAKEQYIAKIGRNDNKHAQSHLWCHTDEEKRMEGDIVTGLKLETYVADNGCGYDSLTFQLPILDTAEVPNFRRGDMILFYIKETKTDNVSTRQVHKGTLLNISTHTLHIGLRQSQHSIQTFPSSATYAMEHDVSDSASNSLYRNLYSFLCAPEERQQLLIGATLPQSNIKQKLIGHYPGEETDKIVLTVKQANDYALIVGAPGAGKTSIVLRSIVEEYYNHTASAILLMAYTNRAVDEICRALGNMESALQYIRLGSELSCDEQYAHRTLTRLTASMNNRNNVRSLIDSTRIIVSTVSTASTHSELFAAKHFDLTIIDEASQILEPQLIGLLASITGKFVLIGDHKQLPAISQQTEEEACICEEELIQLGFSNCKQSLFERLHRRLIATNHTSCIANLYRQGRMHPDVSRFANQYFYNNQLRPVPLPHQTSTLPYTLYDKTSHIQNLIATQRTAFVPCPQSNTQERFKTNIQEVKLCTELVENIIQLYKTNQLDYNPHSTIGIIVPFRNQGALIRHALESINMPEYTENISIDTVERYQGSQRDIIIYCTTVSSPSQMELLADNITLRDDTNITTSHIPIDRKLNVALTRARQQLFVIGIPQVLSTNASYRILMKEL